VLALDGVQEVGLVLVGIERFAQHRTVRRLLDARVVAGGETPRTETRGVLEADAELDLAIAENVGVGSATRAILAQEIFEHARPILFGEADAMQGDAELERGCARVLEVLCAGAVGVVVVPVAHVEPMDVVARAPEQQRGHGGVDAARHADDDAFVRVHGADCSGTARLEVDDGASLEDGIEIH
jgi:hypothetical protein